MVVAVVVVVRWWVVFVALFLLGAGAGARSRVRRVPKSPTARILDRPFSGQWPVVSGREQGPALDAYRPLTYGTQPDLRYETHGFERFSLRFTVTIPVWDANGGATSKCAHGAVHA